MHRFSLVWMILAAVTAVLPFQNIAPVIQVTNLEVIGYTFGEEITFRAVAISESPIQQARLVLQLPGKTEEQTIAADIKSLNAGGMQLQATYKLAGQNLPAFSTLGYYFKVVTPTGQEYTSPLARFDYLDNRYEWQTLPGTRFQVHWFNGNSDTAQSVQQIAQAGYERMQDLLELKELPQVEIYIYPDSASLQGVLAESGKDWIAGRAALEKGVILVALPPGPDQQVFVEQRVPHELLHVSLYRKLGGDYLRLPTWLSEGLASVAEIYPDPDYPLLVKKAYEESRLPALSALCPAFPNEASAALLAYAESTSVTRYILNHYGKSEMAALINAYASGQNCESGPISALGISLSELEQLWRDETFGKLPASAAQSEEIKPWLILLAVILAAPLLVVFFVWRMKPPAR